MPCQHQKEGRTKLSYIEYAACNGSGELVIGVADCNIMSINTYASPYLWNQLPSSFRQPHSVHCNPGSPHPAHITSSQSPPSLPSPITTSTFHSRLKTHLFHKSFPP